MKASKTFVGKELTKSQQKKIIGGDDPGSCTESCGEGANVVTCSSSTGSCSRSPINTTLPWIKCDGKSYDCPKAPGDEA